MITFFKRKYNNLLNRIYRCLESRRLKCRVASVAKERKVYLFSVPTHPNLGDQAQTMSIMRWLRELYPDYKIVEVPKILSTPVLLDSIGATLLTDDKLFVHSGYLMYDIHPELPFICDVVARMKGHRVVILPQTINLTNEKVRKRVLSTFNAHGNLKLCCRDEVSYNMALKDFPECEVVMMPDFVTSLIGRYQIKNTNHRKGVIFLLRNDGEKLYDNDALLGLQNRLEQYGTTIMDTTVYGNAYDWKYWREQKISKIIDRLAQARLVITDRYHGVIFSQVASTPVIVIDSADHKLSSGVRWFPREAFGRNVNYAKSLDEAYSLAEELLAESYHKENGNYFYRTYFKTQL